jgi:hypothetical protein
VALAVLLAGCTSGSPSSTGTTASSASTGTSGTPAGKTVAAIPVQVSRAPQQATVDRWGAAPQPGPEVTLQPDVIIVGGGGTAIRNATEDGLTYYLDP